MITRYFVNWEYGEHHYIVETNMRDMFGLIENMCSEFQVDIKETDINLGEHRKAHVIEYSIENYYGDRVVFAHSSEESVI